MTLRKWYSLVRIFAICFRPIVSPETLLATEFGGHGSHGGWVFQGWEDCCFIEHYFRVWLNIAA